MHMNIQSVVKDSIDTFIDVLNTQAFTEDKIEDNREHAYISNLGCHSRAHFQRKCNRIVFIVTPFSLVDPFDHNATSACAIVFQVAIPIAFHRFPRFRIITSVKDYFFLSFCANVGPWVSGCIPCSIPRIQRWCCLTVPTSHEDGLKSAIRVHCGHLKSWPHVSVLLHRRPSWYPRLPGTLSVEQLYPVSTRDSFLLDIPKPTCVGSFFDPFLQKGFSILQALFSFSRSRMIQDAYHFDITDVNAIVL